MRHREQVETFAAVTQHAELLGWLWGLFGAVFFLGRVELTHLRELLFVPSLSTAGSAEQTLISRGRGSGASRWSRWKVWVPRALQTHPC